MEPVYGGGPRRPLLGYRRRMVEGRVTRGTTGTNRLRRVDRYLAASPALRRPAAPLVVDLGFGARPWTALELADRLARVRSDVRVLGLEIDPARVAAAMPSATDRVSFGLGGFEVPTPTDERKAIIHRNVPGERVHDLLRALDDRWTRASPLSVYGPVQRFVATAEALRDAGWPIEGGSRRWRLGELTVPWEAVAPG